MKNVSLMGVVILGTIAGGCAFENTSQVLTPTAPSPAATPAGGTTSGTPGGSNTSNGGSSTGSTPSSTPASAFAGAWAASSFAGLPVNNCADMKWAIAEQSPASIAGTVSATCQGGTTVSANLTGQVKSENVMDLRQKAASSPSAFRAHST